MSWRTRKLVQPVHRHGTHARVSLAEGSASRRAQNLDIDLRKVRLEVEKLSNMAPAASRSWLPATHTRAKKVIACRERSPHAEYNHSARTPTTDAREQEGVVPGDEFLDETEDVREEVLNLLGHKYPGGRVPETTQVESTREDAPRIPRCTCRLHPVCTAPEMMRAYQRLNL